MLRGYLVIKYLFCLKDTCSGGPEIKHIRDCSLAHVPMTAVQAERIKTSADVVLNVKLVGLLKICCLISVYQGRMQLEEKI